MKQLLLVVISFIFLSATSFQQTDERAKVKVTYLYNFSKYIEWPSDYKEGKFIITIVENSNEHSILSELNKMAQSKMSPSNQKFEIKSVSKASEIVKSHIVYVSPECSSQLTEVIGKVKSNSTLIVTDKPGLLKQGSIINLVIKENRQRFEFNNTDANKHKLKVSPDLTRLAVSVE